MDLGKRIASLRRQKRMTQEQLGKAVGCSAQAVSKWETGGAPDIEMLPKVADCLGVTIDTLFGRSNTPKEDMKDILLRYLTNLPLEKRFTELFRILCYTIGLEYHDDGGLLKVLSEQKMPLDSPKFYELTQNENPYEDSMVISSVTSDFGILRCIPAKDFPLYLLMPEPPKGYLSNFAENEKYRKLFTVLSQPGVLEILIVFHSKKIKLQSAKALAKSAKISIEIAENALIALENINLVSKGNVQIEEEPTTVYQLAHTKAFIPFMTLSRIMCIKTFLEFFNHDNREKPLLKDH